MNIFFQNMFSSIKIHKQEDFFSMQRAGQLAAQTLDFIEPYVKPGISTEELDILCHDFIIKNQAVPAPLNYRGFPKSVCTSVNNVACHGIPNKNLILKENDIIGIDVTVILDGWHGDTSRTFFVGTPRPEDEDLVKCAYESMWTGIRQAFCGNRLGNIGHYVQEFAESKKFSVVRDFCGHGIGRVFHDEPIVLFAAKKNTGPIIKDGMFFTIEPIINAGNHQVFVGPDKWTAFTKDGKKSAQFEHTIGIFQNKTVVFTINEKEKKQFPEFCLDV